MSSFVSHTLRTGLIAAGLALGTVVVTLPATAQTATAPSSESGVVARGTGFTITEKDIAAASDNPALGAANLPEEQRREALISYLVDLKILGQAAEAAKLDKDPEFANKLAEMRQQLLVETFLEKEVQKLVTPEAARKLYDDTTKDMKPEQEVRARHILVETEDQAKAVIERLKKGEDFAKVAAELSKDPGSKDSGGELGFFTKDRMVGPFAEAAFKLEPNQISEPVQTQFGWHVIQTEEKRAQPVPSFDDLKPQIEAFLNRQSQQQVITALREKAKVERLDKPAAPAAEQKAPAEAPKDTKKK